jgi:uncharacterized membrane protein
MFQWNFLFTEYNARTNLAILFFALAMMVLFNDRIEPLKKRILFIVFMASCMVSHYSTTYIFFFIMLGTFVGIELLSKKYTVKKVVTLTIVVLFFSMIFFWYSQVTETAFNAGVVFIENTISSLNRFFVEESRGGGAQVLLGGGFLQAGIPQKIEFVFTWLTFALIGIGVATLLVKRKEMSFPELNIQKPDFLKNKFEVTYFALVFACTGLLVGMIALPFLSDGYNLDRSYAFAITILSVFFVIGGITLSKHFFFLQKKTCAKRKSINQNTSQVRAYLIILLILIPYFLCVTSMVCQIFGAPRAIILNSNGKTYDHIYVHDQESHGAKWLKDYAKEDQKIYTDYLGQIRLTSQGVFSPSAIDYWSLIGHRNIAGYIYLRYQNTVAGKLSGLDFSTKEHNITEYSYIITKKNEIYDSGCSKIYR